MSDPVTIDASVFVNAFSATEEGSDRSWKYIIELKGSATQIIVPTLLLIEVAASIARKQNNAILAMQLMADIQAIPHITLIDLDESLARTAAEIAATYRLRGSDAVYVAVAMRFATELVTLDREQLQRAKKAVKVRKP
jgi:predicted nucleic acid-binding protein